MSDFMYDNDHGYIAYVQRYVDIQGEGINAYLDTGLDAIRYLIEIIKENKINNAKRIKKVDEFNYDIVFKGSDLLDFLKEFYPNSYDSYTEKIKPENEYKVGVVDLS